MLGQFLVILLNVYLTTKVYADCHDITLDYCIGNPPFQVLKLSREQDCQEFCSQIFPDVCTFFIHDRQQDLCQLYDYDPQEYADSCDLIAGTPTPSLAECKELNDNCLVRFYTIR